MKVTEKFAHSDVLKYKIADIAYDAIRNDGGFMGVIRAEAVDSEGNVVDTIGIGAFNAQNLDVDDDGFLEVARLSNIGSGGLKWVTDGSGADAFATRIETLKAKVGL